eukprot:scaffold166639_cov13-Tisochrysis_lutea.AAC.1
MLGMQQEAPLPPARQQQQQQQLALVQPPEAESAVVNTLPAPQPPLLLQTLETAAGAPAGG